ncbi:MAG: UDP-N-acetylglucosamine 2-epimerase (non-hydrolyzing) [Planctomycetota bacterium]
MSNQAEPVLKIACVVGARPNFMKMAPLVRELKRRGHETILVHTGQHYDENMSKVFFDDLGMPEPDVYLGVGSGSHSRQTATVMIEFERICEERKPDLIVVVGDVNSTLACALVGAKMWIPVAHVEAGLRSFDARMPEEINRVITDRISDLLLTPSPDGDANLEAEGIPADRVHLVGNIMIDSLLEHLERAKQSSIVSNLGLADGEYAVLTLHRPSNVDDPAVLTEVLDAVRDVSASLPVAFSCHPRTRQKIGQLPGLDLDAGNVKLLEPLGYIDFLSLVSRSRLVMTDSGGLQEETTALGIPCLTIRENTERPITVEQGTNRIVGTDGGRIREECARALSQPISKSRVPALWDGRTAGRVADVIESWNRRRSERGDERAG